MQNEIAAIVRALRDLRGSAQEELAEISSQANLSRLEQGKTQVSLVKLSKIARTLDFDLVALVALCQALQDGSSPIDVMAKASKDLEGFIALGGLQGLKRHWGAGEGLVKRTRGKPSSPDRIRAVLELKASGMSKAEVSRVLAIPEASVRRYWLKDLPG
ncbi:Fis family transcriptional regulator [Pseudomonas sp. FH4]|uniref:helix-turn-helix domain-containing protein n=1 Tax=Pseudomonas fluorescens group TaxID=136843 RepID=UPI0003DBD2E0|nr:MULTISPECIES: helix-turn-helix transcriptional regulator [Pseudomonas fluorescens group]ETK21293.1 Fis family transcriptional regulator [Pseudomonas sp. FH4]MBF8003990.1 helix-turn-helix transcriptional regulator [Pseudomonas brenneri]